MAAPSKEETEMNDLMPMRIGNGPWYVNVPVPVHPGSQLSIGTTKVTLPVELQAYYDSIYQQKRTENG